MSEDPSEEYKNICCVELPSSEVKIQKGQIITEGELKICYHGTNENAATKIREEGFFPYTYFSLHLEDAIGYGGRHVFRVVFPQNFTKLFEWQFKAPEAVTPDRICSYRVYSVTKVFENKDFGDKVLQRNLKYFS